MSNNKVQYPEAAHSLQEDLHQPLVSVIICFYNEEQFLEEAIESVLKQDYKNLELLLVDDGSIDKSTQIAIQFADNFPAKVYYCEHEKHINKGLSASRNLGIKQAEGKYIAFLDADDVWLPAKLLSQVSIFQRNPDIGMIIEGSEYWYNWNDLQNENVRIFIGAAPETIYDPPQLIFSLYPLGNGAAPVPSGLIIKKESIQRCGSFEESFIKKYSLYEDQAFLAKIYLQEKIYVSSECNNLYRQRTGSIVESVKANGDYHTVRRYFLEWLNDYLINKKIQNAKLDKLLKKALMPYHHPLLYFFYNTMVKKIGKISNRIMPKNIKQFIKHNFSPVK